MYTNTPSPSSGRGQNAPSTPPSQTGAAYHAHQAHNTQRGPYNHLPPSPYTPTSAQRGPYYPSAPQAPHIPQAALPSYDTSHGLLTPPTTPARPRVYHVSNLHILLTQPTSAFYLDLSTSVDHIYFYRPEMQALMHQPATTPPIDRLSISAVFDTVTLEISNSRGRALTVYDVLNKLCRAMQADGRLQKVAPAVIFNGLAQCGAGYSLQVKRQ